MTPFVVSQMVFHATRDEFDCNILSDESLSDSEVGPLNQRRVRFHSAKPKVLNPETEYFLEDECLVRWWTTEELQKIRKSVKALCARIRYHRKCQDYELITAHRKITLMLASDFSTLTKMPLSLPDQDLSAWCSYNDGRRGLERFASKVYSCFRMNDIVVTREGVLREQLRQRQEGVTDPEMIAEVCQIASRRARSFAQFMAGADAQQVGEGEAMSTPQKRSKISEKGQRFQSI